MLADYLCNEGKPKNEDEDEYSGWCAGEQLGALRFYLNSEVEILAEYMEDDWQGECCAVLKAGGLFYLWRDWFGSCSGCDSLEDGDGYAYIKATLAEGNSRGFETLDAAEKYIHTTEDYHWKHKASLLGPVIAEARERQCESKEGDGDL